MRRSKRILILAPVVGALTLVAALAVTLAVVVLPGRAGAEPPTRTTVDLTATFQLPTAYTGCGFTITLTQAGSGTVTTYYDQSGNPRDIFTRAPQLAVAYISQSGKAYTSTSPATTHVDLANNTITYDGLQAHIIIPGQGLIGSATGHVVFNTQTGALIRASGQTTFLTPFSPDICALLAQ